MKNKIKKFLVKGNISNQDNRKSAGITLVALIITIIVLLILAGVTINMVFGENGLINKSKTSVAKYENAQEKENSSLAGYENEINGYINGDREINQYDEKINNLVKVNDLKVELQDLLTSDTFLDRVFANQDTLDYVFANEECTDILFNNEFSLKKIVASQVAKQKIFNDETIYNKFITNNGIPEKLGKSVPTLSSNTSSSLGAAFCSSKINNNYDAYKAFDGNRNAEYQWATNTKTNQYVGFTFNNNINIYRVDLISVPASWEPQNTKSWYIQYSDNGSNWTKASDTITRSGDIDPVTTTATVYFNSGAHKYWRVFCMETFGSNYLGVGELKFYGVY